LLEFLLNQYLHDFYPLETLNVNPQHIDPEFLVLIREKKALQAPHFLLENLIPLVRQVIGQRA
jgi:hypothetical protein